MRNEPPCVVDLATVRRPEPVLLEQLVEAVRVEEPQMLVVDRVPLAAHHARKVVVLRDQHPVVVEQDVDGSHHLVDVLDVREHVARCDHLRRPVVREDPLREPFVEERLVRGVRLDAPDLAGRLHPDRPAALEL